MGQNNDLLYIQTYKKILESNNILILTHINPDGDCLGAGKALCDFILSINKKCDLLVTPQIPKNFEFLEINNNIDAYINKSYDLFIMLDANDLKRCSFFDEIDYKNLIIFDHHINNLSANYKESIKIINEKASSTCEIIYNFFSALSIKINKKIASALLTGILTDTGSFMNQATNNSSIIIAEKLINSGADTYLINKNINKNNTLNTLGFFELVLKRIKINKKLNIVSTYFTLEDLKKYNLTEDNIPSISSLLNDLYDYNFIMVIKEIEKGVLSFSLRTNKDIDLSKICGFFGGGGHKKASGFKMKGNIKELIF